MVTKFPSIENPTGVLNEKPICTQQNVNITLSIGPSALFT